MAFDEQLAERIRKGLVGHHPVEKRMFGGLCFMVKGAMCCGVYKMILSRVSATISTTRQLRSLTPD
jgi:hypothetical protein